MLKYLAQRYEVHLGAFVDDPFDWKYKNEVEALCKEVKLIRLKPATAKIKSLAGFLSGRPLSLPYYANKEMQRWIQQTTSATKFHQVLVFSSSMVQYVPKTLHSNTVVDFVDIDSNKWEQYAAKKSFPMSLVYRREGKKLFQYEDEIAKSVKYSLFVSPIEAQMFKELIQGSEEKIGYFNNGVDSDYFDPGAKLKNPFPKHITPIVFTGAMDYWANIEGVQWFCQHCWPSIHQSVADARFYIVGGNPAESVTALAKDGEVIVTGRVEDIRPYLKYADLVVAPLRVARGVQNKVLEAMSMGKRVILTPQAMEGIEPFSSLEADCLAESSELAERCIGALGSPPKHMLSEYRAFILKHYNWIPNLDRLNEYLQ